MGENIVAYIDRMKNQMVESLGQLIGFPAISPHDGGIGEVEKARFIAKLLLEKGLPEAEWHNAPDEKAPEKYRPNLIVRIPGRTKKRLWIITHMDVVPEGDSTLWNTSPFKASIKDGRIFGRGSSDNGQELIASIFAAVALKEQNIVPEYEVCLCFVADEELGSLYGIQYLIKEGLFSSDDLVVVPDGGNERGDFIEVAEKSILWVQWTVTGKQVHGSRPDLGLNACRIANEFAMKLDGALHEAFPEKNELFSPPLSTFEPTRRLANVSNVNTIPGKEVFCLDCRILPSINVDEVLKVMEQIAHSEEQKSGAEIDITVLQRTDSTSPTPSDALVVKLLSEAVKEVYSFAPVIGGVGGGTCAAYFRKNGVPAVVWGQEADVAHMPNEYCEITHLVNETKVFALMMAGSKNTFDPLLPDGI